MSNTMEIQIEILGVEFTAEVEFNFSAGSNPIINADPDFCDPGEPDEVEINSLKIIGETYAIYLDMIIGDIEDNLINQILESRE